MNIETEKHNMGSTNDQSQWNASRSATPTNGGGLHLIEQASLQSTFHRFDEVLQPIKMAVKELQEQSSNTKE